jgi:hypothetical protein
MQSCQLCNKRGGIWTRYKLKVCILCNQLITDSHKLYFQLRGKKGPNVTR